MEPSAPSSMLDGHLWRQHKGGPHPIHASIKMLDKLGMDSIETGSHDRFAEYLDVTRNTICGRHPIGLIMAAIEEVAKEHSDEDKDKKGKFKFVRYERSSLVEELQNSSVSYASAFAVV
jgi:AmmeMemoRadiSam system protein B